MFRPAGSVKVARRLGALGALGAVLAVALLQSSGAGAADPCTPPVVNPVACENTKPGDPKSAWDVSGAGTSTIQGFATDISVNRGQTVTFKVKTPARSYRLDVYRMGYYAGAGARKVATVLPSATLPQTQPNCLTQAATGLVDCGNWAVSASWAVPGDAVSGIHFAKLVRTDGTAGSSHVFFVVRDDAGRSDLLFQTSDTTWQAYNRYGGNSLYTGSPAGRAYKVSYNRPFSTRGATPEDFVFNAEYPMVRWLEANGYDVSYSTGVDSDRNGALIRNHKAFLSVGHDEYWSAAQRANVEAARDAGVSLAFLSGNEIYWKTRWEPGIDASARPHRTLVSYKETHAGARIDPAGPATWTGTWRDPRFSPPADGGRPENALSGTLFMVNGEPSRANSIRVGAASAPLRFWRNTSVAGLTGAATKTMPAGTLGYEWDSDLDNGSRPAGLVPLSRATYDISADLLLDFGSTFGSGTANHTLTLYRAPGGGLVFGAGTIQWAWGLDANHDRTVTAVDADMRQATANLLADMGAQPATMQAGLVAAQASTDAQAPTSTITAPAAGATVRAGEAVTVTGAASDAGGGVVGVVEVSTDDGRTWHRATGTSSWTYSWTRTVAGPTRLRTRAADDSANLEAPGAGVAVDVQPRTCPCSIWSASTTPVQPSDPDPGAVELGVKFRSDTSGFITGLRYYKGAQNTGTHVGRLWSASGQLLRSATFSGESASGWQTVSLAQPVAVSADTTYVASYTAPNGRYAADEGYFSATGVDAAPLRALRSGADGPNGVYGAPGTFPASTFADTNYWVDVVYATAIADTHPPQVGSRSPAADASGVAITAPVTATFDEAVQAGTIGFALRAAGGAAVPATTAYDAASRTATLTPDDPLAESTMYTATVSGARDAAGNTMSAESWSFTTAGCPCTLWPGSTVPGTPAAADDSAVELGVRFRSASTGFITALRFYKGPGNNGPHVGHLWSASGTLLSSATFQGETATGWQQVTLPAPVAIQANTSYIASYHAPVGRYAATNDFFATAGRDAPPLEAPRNGVVGANGVYVYGAPGFPSFTYRSSNYWVDVVFDTEAQDTTAPTVTGRSPAPDSDTAPATASVTATFGEPVQASTVDIAVAGPGGAVAGSTAYDGPSRTARFTPAANLEHSTQHTATVSGAKDAAGNTMSPVTWSFTTAAPPPPPAEDGPGGPVLLVTSGANPFSTYLAEILRGEGLSHYRRIDVSALSAAQLTGHDLVLLGDVPVSAAQVTALSDFVDAGGSLIATRPDSQLAGVLGLAPAGGTLSEGYVKVDTATEAGAGIAAATMQFHGAADRYALSGATAIATLYSDATTATAHPAVSRRTVGASGGQAAAFTYDLARSVVLTRQGNPAWEGVERDGSSPIRSDDLYFGGAEPDWVDLGKVAIPQADEQQRLLANLVVTMNRQRKPLPRFWYFPDGHKAVVIATGDDHGNGGTAARFEQYLANSPAGCSVAAWTCPRFSSYIYSSTPLGAAQATTYDGQGFEVGLHVSTGCANFTPASLQSDFAAQLGAFGQKYTGVAPPATSRTHCITWSDWAGKPVTEAANGIRLDTNYYYWPGGWVADRPGFFTGSGMPMRFARADGSTIDVYQAATQMTDESSQSYPYTPNTLLDAALGPQGAYGAFTANMHTDQATIYENDSLLASAQARNVPIVSARQMLTWLDGRNSSSFADIGWAAGTLTFSVRAGSGARGLTAMLPTQSSAGTLASLSLDGAPVSVRTETIKGLEYAFFATAPGTYTAQYSPAGGGGSGLAATGPGATFAAAGLVRRAPRVARRAGVRREAPRARAAQVAPPALADVRVEALPDGTASVQWTTDQPAAASVEVGGSATALERGRVGYGLTRAARVVLTRLGANRRQFYRVASRNAAGRAQSAVASFVTPDFGVADSRLAQLRMGRRTSVAVSDDSDGELRLAAAGAGRARSGSFESRLLDAQQMVSWRRALWFADVPAGTSLTVSLRTGSTSTPDASWSKWAAVPAGGAAIGAIAPDSRYLQYRAELTGNGSATPVLRSVGFTSNGREREHPTEAAG